MPTPQYGDYQMEIYGAGLQGKQPRFPLDYASLEQAAAEVLPFWVYSYVGYGAGDGNTQRANVDAFSHYGIVPRMLVGATERDLSVSLFDMKLPTPLFMPRSESSACALRTCTETSRRLKPPHKPESPWWHRR